MFGHLLSLQGAENDAEPVQNIAQARIISVQPEQHGPALLHQGIGATWPALSLCWPTLLDAMVTEQPSLNFTAISQVTGIIKIESDQA